MLWDFQPTHCLSQMYFFGLLLDVVTTWGDDPLSLETHLVLGLSSGALITFWSFSNFDAFFHMASAWPLESIPESVRLVYGIDNEIVEFTLFCETIATFLSVVAPPGNTIPCNDDRACCLST